MQKSRVNGKKRSRKAVGIHADIIAPGRTRAAMADDLIALQKRAEKAEE